MYSAAIPYLDVKLMSNDSEMGNATIQNTEVQAGLNTGLIIQALWSPRNDAVAREFLSQYVSGAFYML